MQKNYLGRRLGRKTNKILVNEILIKEKINMRREKKYSDECLLNILRFKTEELGRTPKCREVPRYWTIIRRFGSWNGAVECAGVQVCSINQIKVKQ